MDTEDLAQINQFVPGLQEWFRRKAALAIARHLLTLLAVVLTKYHLLPADAQAGFIAAHLNEVVSGLMLLVSIGGSILAARNRRDDVHAAVTIEPGATVNEIKERRSALKAARKAAKSANDLAPDTD